MRQGLESTGHGPSLRSQRDEWARRASAAKGWCFGLGEMKRDEMAGREGPARPGGRGSPAAERQNVKIEKRCSKIEKAVGRLGYQRTNSILIVRPEVGVGNIAC